jgi:hypothetical protein
LRYKTSEGVEPCGMLLSLHALKLCDVPLTKYALVLPSLRTLEINTRYCITDLSKHPDLVIARLTVH